MPYTMTPQAPLRPLHVEYHWSGGKGTEVLDVTITIASDAAVPGAVPPASVVYEYEVDFSGLGPDDAWNGVDMPEGVPAWANVIAAADRDANGVLHVALADWNHPDSQGTTTHPYPWEADQ